MSDKYVRNEEIFNLFKEIIINRINKKDSLEKDKTRLFQIPNWQHRNLNFFEDKIAFSYHWYFDKIDSKETLNKLDTLLKEDALFSRYIDYHIWDGYSGLTIETDRILGFLFRDFINEERIEEYDDIRLSSRYKLLENELIRDEINSELILILYNFDSDIDKLLFTDNISLEILNNEEIIALLNKDFKFPFSIPGSYEISIDKTFGLRFKKKIEKQFKRSDEPISKKGEYFKENIFDIENINELRKIIDSLKIFQSNDISEYCIIGRNDYLFNPTLTFGKLKREPKHISRTKYLLKLGQETELLGLWKKKVKIERIKKSFFPIAVRRFSQSYNRNGEDRIIDLMICAEALFLGSQIDDVKGELTYRMAMNASKFISDMPNEQLTINKFFRFAYGVRSDIVHGNLRVKLIYPKKSDPNSHEWTIDEICTQLEDYLRIALRKIIEEEIIKPSGKIKWDNYLFPTNKRS